MNHLAILHYLFKIRALLFDTEKSIEKIRDYDRHKSRERKMHRPNLYSFFPPII
jgi:hypothetical protein